MNRELYRRAWLRLRRGYERNAFRIIINSLKKTAKKIPFDQLNETNYASLINVSVDRNDVFNAYFKIYQRIGLIHGERVGKGINKDIKKFELGRFTELFRRSLIQWLNTNAGQRIIIVRQNFIQYLIDIIANGIENNQTIRQIAKDIQNRVDSPSFYKWQALRIARTETTAAANQAAAVAGNASTIVLEKEWISSNDSRTRRQPKDEYDHIEMDFVKVEENGLFDVQGDLIRYPGDPNGRAENTINCRCTVALVPKRDAQGRLIPKI